MTALPACGWISKKNIAHRYIVQLHFESVGSANSYSTRSYISTYKVFYWDWLYSSQQQYFFFTPEYTYYPYYMLKKPNKTNQFSINGEEWIKVKFVFNAPIPFYTSYSYSV